METVNLLIMVYGDDAQDGGDDDGDVDDDRDDDAPDDGVDADDHDVVFVFLCPRDAIY